MKLLLGKHELAYDVTKVCSIEYLTTQIELVLPTFFQLLDRHNIVEYLTLICNTMCLTICLTVYHISA